MKQAPIALQFELLGISYKGWAKPSDERYEDGHPKHYQVFLNGYFFGKFSFDRGKWVVDEDRPRELVLAAGDQLSERILDRAAVA